LGTQALLTTDGNLYGSLRLTTDGNLYGSPFLTYEGGDFLGTHRRPTMNPHDFLKNPPESSARYPVTLGRTPTVWQAFPRGTPALPHVSRCPYPPA